jgi:hypothetical protein
MKAQFEKHKGKIVLQEVREENNKEKLEQEKDIIRELQEKVKYLEVEQKPRLELDNLQLQQLLLVLLDMTKQRPWKRTQWSSKWNRPGIQTPLFYLQWWEEKNRPSWGLATKMFDYLYVFKTLLLLGQFVRLYTSQSINSCSIVF